METLSSKVPPDVKDEIEEFAEERGLSRSQAIRRLVKTGLEEHETGTDVSLRVVIAWLGSLMAAAMLAVPVGQAGYYLGWLGVVLFFGAMFGPLVYRQYIA